MSDVSNLPDTDKRQRRRSRSPTTQEEGSLLRDILFLFLKIGVIILAFFLIFTFVFGIYRNVDASMIPSVKDGDLIIYYRLDKDYILSDAIVLEFEGEKQVRRIVATAGDTVDVTEQGLMVNGALQQEKEIYTPTAQYEEGTRFPITLAEGEVFVLGDARENAADSRIYGAVKIKDTLGKVMTILRWRNI